MDQGILVVCALELDSHHLGGHNHVIFQLVNTLSKSLNVTLVIPKSEMLKGFYATAIEEYKTANHKLTVESWPVSDFSIANRQVLLHKLEQKLVSGEYSRLVSFGCYETGVSSAIACRLTDTKLACYLTYSDAFEHHLSNPSEFELVCNSADILLSSNPNVFRHLSAYHNVPKSMYCVENVSELFILEDDFVLDEYRSYVDKVSNGERFVITTGRIGRLNYVGEMCDYISALMVNGKIKHWVHAGKFDQKNILEITKAICISGLEEKMTVTGSVNRSRLRALMVRAEILVKPGGEIETGISVIEAKKAGIPVSVYFDFPPELLDLENGIIETRGGSIHTEKLWSPIDFRSVCLQLVA